MIFIALSTQDKQFTRLLEAVERNVKSGLINDKVIVQAGSTSFKSKYMEIFDYVSPQNYDELISKCDLLITHGGVATILSGVRNNKKVIAVPRLKEYGEHVNDHQKQIVEQFSKDGYIIACMDPKKLNTAIQKSKNFIPKKCKFDNKLMLNTIRKFIDDYEKNK